MEPKKLSQSSEMEPSSAPFTPFKSKKIIRSTSKTSSSNPDTPEKPIQSTQRTRNRNAVFSLNQVKKIAHGLKKSSKVESSDPIDLTESGSQKGQKKKKKGVDSIELPQKFEILAKFFDSMVCSIRLLRMRRTTPLFGNIGKQIESMTDRRFSYNHLAQLKYILPEAIVLKKELVFDDQTLCLKPCLQIMLEIEAIENEGKWKSGIGYSNVGKVFRARLLDFSKAHPEADDIPEETLPEPFNQMKEKAVTEVNQASIRSLPVESSTIAAQPRQNLAAASHLNRSFKTRFVQRVPISESEKTPLLPVAAKASSEVVPNKGTPCTDVPSLSGASSVGLPPRIPVKTDDEVTEPAKTKDLSPQKNNPFKAISTKLKSTPVKICDEVTKLGQNKDLSSKETNPFQATPTKFASTPVKVGKEVTESGKNKDLSPKETNPLEGTPAKLITSPMSATPVLATPKRCRISQDLESEASPCKLVTRPPRNRPLFQSPAKSAKAKDEIKETAKDKIKETGRSSTMDAYLLNLLPATVVDSIRVQEKRRTEGHDIAISQAKRRRQMIAALPKLFNMIHLMFSSNKRCVVTKQELVHKIIMSHCDIVDRGEIEEQLKLLQDLVPDWISEKEASSGDLLVRVNKMACPDSIRKILEEAV